MFRFRSVNFPRNFRLFSLTFPFVRSIICTIKGASIDCTAIKSNSVRTPISKKEIGVFCCAACMRFSDVTGSFFYIQNSAAKPTNLSMMKTPQGR